MSVYINSKPDEFLAAFESIVNQTVPPNEIVLVIDGPIHDDLEQAINTIKDDALLKTVRFSENKGHAAAHQHGLEVARHEFIANMDSDDVSLPDRFEKQVRFLSLHPEIDIVGGQIAEFMGSPDHVVGNRIVPQTDSEIKEYMKRRSPFNFVTVMFRKQSVMDAGGYVDWFCEEDYYLWARMMLSHHQFANLPDVLVNVRVNNDTYHRRGGWKYFKSEARMQRFMRRHRMISFPREVFNISGRFIIQMLMPNKARAWVFRTFFRNKD